RERRRRVERRTAAANGGARGSIPGDTGPRSPRPEDSPTARPTMGSWAQGCHERDERVDFGGAEILAVSRHVAAPPQDLADELPASLTRRDTVEGRPALSSSAAEAVARPALLVLEHERALQLERRTALDVLHRCGGGGPRLHLRRPRHGDAEPRQGYHGEHDHQDSEHRDGAALPALLARAGPEPDEKEHRNGHHRPAAHHHRL